MTRTDRHRPSAPEFDPQDYTLVDVFDLEPEWPDDRASTVRALVSSGHQFASHQRSGLCGHCGHRIRYAALMIHEPTKQMIYVGETCLDNRFEELTKDQFQALRKAAQLDREKARVLAAYTELIERCSPLVAYASYATNIGASEAIWNFRAIDILSDLSAKARRYGDLSAKQVALISRLMDQLDEMERKHAEKLKAPAAPPVPVGRYVITGEVLSTKFVDNDFGGSLKMLVQHESGWKVWGTVPSALVVERGTNVEFTASVLRSDDDETFGVFKRPTKARVA